MRPNWRKQMKMTYKALIGAMAGLALTTGAFAADITGAGSSFVFPVVAKWAATTRACPAPV
jgi:ABC-type phosphate transport system substrate-binding protein